MLRGRAPAEGAEAAGESPGGEAGEPLPGSRTPTVWPGTCRGRAGHEVGDAVSMRAAYEARCVLPRNVKCDAGTMRAACRRRALAAIESRKG